jgi:hypothetical protein
MKDANVTGDLNQVIASAVQARIETEVATALAGSELMNQYVAAALNQRVQEEPSSRNGYKRVETTFLRQTVETAIRAATKAAVARVIADEAEAIERTVTAEIRKNVKDIAAVLVGKLADAAESAHGINVELRYPGRG